MKTLVLLDSNSLINRAFYALPPLTNRQGQQTGAIFGFVNMFLKLVDKYKPDYVVAAFDLKAPTFRKKMYDGYKATRKPMPAELASQLEPLKRLLKAMNVQIAQLEGFEADDILGTLSKRSSCKTYIVTGDRDSLQLIDDKTTVLMTKKGISEIVEYDEARLKEDGFTPSQIIDLKSLMGDSSDNIPGVAGIGEGTATKLLSQYGTLDNVYAHIDETKGALNKKLTEGKESAYLSYKLATIDRDCPTTTVPEDVPFEYEFDSEVRDILLEFEFNKIADRLTFKGVSAEKTESEKAEKIDLKLVLAIGSGCLSGVMAYVSVAYGFSAMSTNGVVFLISFAVGALLVLLYNKREKLKWLGDYVMAISMLVGMVAACLIF